MTSPKLSQEQAALLGTRIRAARKALGYKTGRDFQRKLGFVERSLYYQWEIGRRIPSEEALKKISKICNVNYEWLVTGKGSPYKGVKISSSDAQKKEALISYEILSQNIAIPKKGMSTKVRNAIVSYAEKVEPKGEEQEVVYIHIDEKLMTAIFTQLIKNFEETNKGIDSAKLSKFASQIYADIVSSERDSRLRHKMIKTVLATYKRFI
ncbi:MAG: helix-turn-helix transcriptional regulator [Gammaproteobacteria bacterium]|nr:helix-turn-helix transcriptional regulator [Gammaproteobacteria bacterium]